MVRRLALFLVALSFLSLTVSRPALAHDDAPTPEEMAAVYEGVMSSIRSLHRTVASSIDDEAGQKQIEEAFAKAVFRFYALYEATVKGECPECQVDQVDPTKLQQLKKWMARKLVSMRDMFRRENLPAPSDAALAVIRSPITLFNAAGHGIKLGAGGTTEIFARFGVLYGLVWGVATAAFEVLEHVIIPFHFGCAGFQAAYHTTALSVFTLKGVGCNPTGDANPFRRFVNAFPAIYYEWKFWRRIGRFFTAAPWIVVEEEIRERHARRLLLQYIDEVDSAVAKDSYTGEALAYLNVIDVPSEPAKATTLLDDLNIIFSGGPKPPRILIAYQHKEGLSIFVEVLRRAVRSQAATLSMPQYVRLKRLLGTIARIVDEYSENLRAAALASDLGNAEAKKRGMAWVLGEILNVFRRPELSGLIRGEIPIERGWLANLAQIYRQDDAVSRLFAHLGAVRRMQHALRRGDLFAESVPACSTIVSGAGGDDEAAPSIAAGH